MCGTASKMVYCALCLFFYQFFCTFFLPRGSSRTSTWLGQPSAWVRFYDKICESQTFFTYSCMSHPIVVAGNFVGVLGGLAHQYLKTMPLQSINRLITESFSYFYTIPGSMTVLMFIDSVYLIYCYHHSSKQDGSIFAAAGDACAYCWDVVCIFLR